VLCCAVRCVACVSRVSQGAACWMCGAAVPGHHATP
jgi:hypothetical protein